MRRRDFHFDLPPESIAQAPLPERSASRLLILSAGQPDPQDGSFAQLPTYLRGDELLVFNDTRVLPARLFAHKTAGGGKAEILLERVLEEGRARVRLRTSKPMRVDQALVLDQGVRARVVAVCGEGFYELALEDGALSWQSVCEQQGHVPLPPYIRRPDDRADRERYQTVFAQHPGAVAAPTAGLHFDAALLAELAGRGVEQAFITLHVGAGTFQPMRTEQVAEHHMHAEWACVPAAACAAITKARREGRAVVAVGTTVARTLEAAAGTDGHVEPLEGEISNFIYPGYSFKIVDGLITNFHLPESTLLMLVCALGGTERVLRAYRHAVGAGYRFFSYGDAMLLMGA